MYDFSGKSAVVTGAGKGIGTAVVERFFQDGMPQIAILDMDLELAAATAKRIDPTGKKVIAIKCDVSDEAGVVEAFKKVIEAFGKIDILVNNAGMTRDSMFHKMNSSQFKSVMDVHVNGTFNCTSQVIPGMRERKYGRIIGLSSAAAFGNIGQTNYSAAKAALIGFTSTLALEVASRGITVNCIAPSLVRTDIVKSIPDDVMEIKLDKIPMKRMGEPSEVAALVAFLASDESAYISGQCIKINGGKA